MLFKVSTPSECFVDAEGLSRTGQGPGGPDPCAGQAAAGFFFARFWADFRPIAL